MNPIKHIEFLVKKRTVFADGRAIESFIPLAEALAGVTPEEAEAMDRFRQQQAAEQDTYEARRRAYLQGIQARAQAKEAQELQRRDAWLNTVEGAAFKTDRAKYQRIMQSAFGDRAILPAAALREAVQDTVVIGKAAEYGVITLNPKTNEYRLVVEYA